MEFTQLPPIYTLLPSRSDMNKRCKRGAFGGESATFPPHRRTSPPWRDASNQYLGWYTEFESATSCFTGRRSNQLS